MLDKKKVDSMNTKTKIVFIVNPNAKSGQGVRKWIELYQELLRRGLEREADYEVSFTTCAGHAVKLARQYSGADEVCRGETELILGVVGGDGTLDEVLNGVLSFAHTKIFYFPAGSGNDFARSTGVERNSAAAAELLLMEEPPVSVYDYGRLEIIQPARSIRRFAESAGIGYDADVCRAIHNSAAKNIFNRIGLGKLAYTFLGLVQIFKCRPVDGWLETDEGRVEFQKMYFTSVHIHPYEGGGFRFAPDADAGDGLLDICLVSDINRFAFILALFAVLFQRKSPVKGIRRLKSRKCKLHVNRPRQVHCDGEIMGLHRNVAFCCEKAQLRMIRTDK